MGKCERPAPQKPQTHEGVAATCWLNSISCLEHLLLRFALFQEGVWISGCTHGCETPYFTVFYVNLVLRFALFQEGGWILGCPHGSKTLYFTVFSVHFVEGPAEDGPQMACKPPRLGRW